MKQIIAKNNWAIVINSREYPNGTTQVWANAYVNARNGIESATITGIRWEGKTIAGAVRWANKQLEGA